MVKNRKYEDFLDEQLKDPAEAAGYLTACLDADDPDGFLLALKDVARARGGGLAQLAADADLNREHLYRMLSDKGNPGLRSLGALLDELGLQLAVKCRDAG